MKLTIYERIAILGVLPKEGDFTTLKILRDLQNLIGFSEEDHKKFKIVQENGQIRWDEKEGLKKVNIELGEKAREIIKNALLDLDKQKKLEPRHYTIYERFVQDKQDEGPDEKK